MNEHQRSNSSDDNPLKRIGATCDEFRAEIKRGRTPQIETYLNRVDEDVQEHLFNQLLQIEVGFRGRAGETPNSKEYIERFPQFSRIIRQAFFEPTTDSSVATESPAFNPLADVPATLEISGANRIGEYELIRELGRGGFGIVYEAKHIKRGHLVALKALPVSDDGRLLNAERLHRFRREFRSLSEFNHPNLVGMQTLEVDGDRWFFTMDLIDGVDFLTYVRPNNELSEARLIQSLKQLFTGILALHQRGIVHRDLKPSNVLVDANGHVSLLDFGLIAELQMASDQTATLRSGMFAGTPRYAAPEQMFGERSEASDWYAVGTMLYEALTGDVPFTGSQLEVLQKKQNEDPPQISGRQDLSRELSQLTDELLLRNPMKRPSSQTIVDMLGLDVHTTSHASLDDGDIEIAVTNDQPENLIGRETQLAELEAAKNQLIDSRRPVVVFVKGLSGEGKSTLVEHFLRPIRQSKSMLVLSGRCYDRESVPFKVIDSQIESLVRYLRSRDDEDVEKLLPTDIELLARLFPGLRRVKAIDRRQQRPNLGIDDRQVRNLAFAAMKDLLTNISRQTPIVMFVDDLQWGDADSGEVLRELLRSEAPPAILLLGSFRSDEMSTSPFLDEWTRDVEGVDTDPPTCEVRVTPLTETQCYAFLRSRLGDESQVTDRHAAELFENTKGNPYFLEQFLEGFDSESGLFQTVPLPELIKRRLRRSPEGALALLQAIAVSGKAVPLDEVATVADQSKGAFAVITHMRSERLVRLIGTGDEQWVDTYHDKIRETVIEMLDRDQRRQLHLDLANAIEQAQSNGADSKEDVLMNLSAERIFDLAHHFHEAAHPKAFSYQLKAGIAALEAYAMEQSLDILVAADQSLRADTDEESRYQLQISLARAHLGCANWSNAIDSLERALEIAKLSNDRAHCFYLFGEAYWKLGLYKKSEDAFQRGFRELGERIPKTRLFRVIQAIKSIVQVHFLPTWLSIRLRRKPQDQLSRLTQMYSMGSWVLTHMDITYFLALTPRGCLVAERVNDDLAKSEAFASYAANMAFGGFSPLAKLAMRKARKHVSRLKEERLTGLISAYMGMYAYSLGQLDEAKSALKLGRDRLARTGTFLQVLGAHMLWHSWSVSGHTQQLIRFAKDEEEHARKTDDRIVLAYGLYGQAEGYAKQGHIEKAHALADRSLDELAPVNATFTFVAHIQKSRVFIQAGDYDRARKSLAIAIREIFKLRFFDISVPAYSLYVESVASRAWVTRDISVSRRDRIKASFAAKAARLTGLIFPNHRAAALRCSARLANLAGRQRKAKRLFDKAIQAAQKVGANYELARTLIDKSMLDDPDAMANRKRGLSLMQELGCVLPVAEQEYLGIETQPIEMANDGS